MAETETIKCPFCGHENEPAARVCASIPCHKYLKSDLECLRSIDVSLRTIKRIAILWVLLVIAAILGFVVYVINRVA